MSTCLHGVVVGESCLVGAGALLTEATHVPDGTRALGAPAPTFRTDTAKPSKPNTAKE